MTETPQVNGAWRFFRHDTPQGRWYKVLEKVGNDFVDLGYAGSVTTILQALPITPEMIMYWGNASSYKTGCEYRDARGAIGTAIHVAIARLLEGEDVDTTTPLMWDDGTGVHEWTDETRKMIMGFIKWAEDNEPEPILIEAPVFYENQDIRFAGCVDLVASCKERKNGKTTRGIIKTIDWKTSKNLYFSHKVQLLSYSKALYHMGIKVDVLAPVRLYPWKGTPKYQEKPISSDQYNYLFEVFCTTARLWKLTCQEPDFETVQKLLPTQFSIKKLLPETKEE